MIFVNTVEIGLFICATFLTTYLTSVTFTEIMKKIFYDIHETSTDMYTWNACVMALFMVTIITQLKCFTVRRNFHELQTFYANCLARIMMEKPELCGSIKNGELILKGFFTKNYHLFLTGVGLNIFSFWASLAVTVLGFHLYVAEAYQANQLYLLPFFISFYITLNHQTSSLYCFLAIFAECAGNLVVWCKNLRQQLRYVK